MSKEKNNRDKDIERKARGSILTIERKAQRLGMSKRQYLAFRAERNLQRFVDGVAFNVCVALLILLSVVFIFAEFLLPPGETLTKIEYFNDVITWIFVVELGLRFIVAPNKKIYFENYWIDILAVLPVLRIFRTFRLFRLLRLLRLSRAVIILLRQSGWLSERIERNFGNFGILLVTAAALVLCGTIALLTIEHGSTEPEQSTAIFTEKLWQASNLFVSGEVVGEPPGSLAGRITAVLISVSGLVVFAVMVGTISATMTAFFKMRMDVKDLALEDLKDHIIICGWDRMGSLILHELESVSDVWLRGVVVVAETEKDLTRTPGLKNTRRLFHVRGDFTKMDVLESVGVKQARSAIVLADVGHGLRDQDRDARTVLAALTLEKLNPGIFTCAELLDEANATHLKIAGVEEIISRTTLTAGLFAATLINRGITSVIGDLLTHQEGAYLRKFSLPEEFVGHEFIEVFDHFKREYDATILAVDWKTENDRTKYERHLNPSHDRRMDAEDMLVVVAKVDSVFKELTS